VIELERLISLALGEVDDAQAAELDEHILACTACATTLSQLLALGPAVHAVVHGGHLPFAAPASLVERLDRAGLVSRTYRLRPGQAVPCSVGATDVYAATHLEADLSEVERVDLVRVTPIGDVRVEDVPFDRERGVVSLISPSETIRTYPTMQIRLRLVAVDVRAERVLGEYTLDHSASS
jgi:hypothetical protein